MRGHRAAAHCDEVMDAVEDVVTRVVATFDIENAAEMKAGSPPKGWRTICGAARVISKGLLR